MNHKSCFLLCMAMLVTLLSASPARAQGAQACLYCAENGFSDDTCETAVTWVQWNDSFEECEVVEKCRFFIFCWQFCRMSTPCITNPGNPFRSPGTKAAATTADTLRGDDGNEALVRRCGASEPLEFSIPA